jgi:hypothetical protein
VRLIACCVRTLCRTQYKWNVNELPDGTVDSIIISKELQKLREIAHCLNLPNANKINWTLIVSVIQLLQDKREDDENQFGPACQNAVEIVENFCYIGVNLGHTNLKICFSDPAGHIFLDHQKKKKGVWSSAMNSN